MSRPMTRAEAIEHLCRTDEIACSEFLHGGDMRCECEGLLHAALLAIGVTDKEYMEGILAVADPHGEGFKL